MSETMQRRADLFFKAWKLQNPDFGPLHGRAGVIGFGFFTRAEADARGKTDLLEVTDEGLAKYILDTWTHSPGLRINPGEDRTVLCVVECG